MRTENDAPEPESDTPASPESADAALARLEAGFEDLSPQLKRAARFIIDNPREVGVQSMRALAGKAEVHPNTLVRLAQAIGFDGFEALRERFRDFLVSEGFGGFRERAEFLADLARQGGSARVLAEMAEATGANLAQGWARAEPERLEAAADAIIGARAVYVLGMGAAYSLAHHFWYVARQAFPHITPLPLQGSQPLDDLMHLQTGDVLIAMTLQPYRAETMEAARAAREAGITLIGVTDSVTSPLAQIADHALVAPTHTPQFFPSHVAVTALLEGLAAVAVARGGAKAASAVDRFQRARQAAGQYAEPGALRRPAIVPSQGA